MRTRMEYSFTFSMFDLMAILEALNKLSNNADTVKPYRDSIKELTDRIKREIREQEGEE